MNNQMKTLQTIWLVVLILSIVSLACAAYNLGWESAKANNEVNCKVVDR